MGPAIRRSHSASVEVSPGRLFPRDFFFVSPVSGDPTRGSRPSPAFAGRSRGGGRPVSLPSASLLSARPVGAGVPVRRSWTISCDGTSSVGRSPAMQHKKPVPMIEEGSKPRRVCPVCGSVSYSRQGVHPQCAREQADAARMTLVKQARAAAQASAPTASLRDRSPWLRECPRCHAQMHIRKATCQCGHQFGRRPVSGPV